MATFAKTFDVDISTGRPAASNEAFYHGETIEFRAVRGRSVVTNIEYSCIWYTTNNSSSVASGEGGWWKTDGLVFHPTNDCGAAAYRFFLEGRDEIGRDWHANGTLRMLPSPGFSPNAIELPTKVLDFAALEVENAPWPAEIEAAIAEIPTPDLSDYATHEEVEEATSDVYEYADVRALEEGVLAMETAIQVSTNEAAYLVGELREEVPTTITNTVTKKFVEDLGIKPEYSRTFGTSTRNRTVQYVNVTNTAPSTLALQIPTDGEVKDWLVYVVSVTNVTLSLPPATYWMSDVAHTNDIAPATPTALYFTEATNGVFVVGRQELTSVSVE